MCCQPRTWSERKNQSSLLYAYTVCHIDNLCTSPKHNIICCMHVYTSNIQKGSSPPYCTGTENVDQTAER